MFFQMFSLIYFENVAVHWNQIKHWHTDDLEKPNLSKNVIVNWKNLKHKNDKNISKLK